MKIFGEIHTDPRISIMIYIITIIVIITAFTIFVFVLMISIISTNPGAAVANWGSNWYQLCLEHLLLLAFSFILIGEELVNCHVTGARLLGTVQFSRLASECFWWLTAQVRRSRHAYNHLCTWLHTFIKHLNGSFWNTSDLNFIYCIYMHYATLAEWLELQHL